MFLTPVEKSLTTFHPGPVYSPSLRGFVMIIILLLVVRIFTGGEDEPFPGSGCPARAHVSRLHSIILLTHLCQATISPWKASRPRILPRFSLAWLVCSEMMMLLGKNQEQRGHVELHALFVILAKASQRFDSCVRIGKLLGHRE